MSLARDLVELEETLRARGLNLFVPTQLENFRSTPEIRAVVPRVESRGLSEPIEILRLCLQALRIQHDELEPQLIDVELVATLPPGVPGIARPTRQVLREMLREDAGEIILLGYEVTDHDMVNLLVERTSRGSDIILICDRERGVASRVLEQWPTDARRPRIYCDQERPGGAPYASMHAKCLLVDGSDLLITSANFTFHGLHGNIEIGVRLSGPPAAEARKIFSHLVETGMVTEIGYAKDCPRIKRAIP